ncbi:MAG: dihydropteroate synthase [Candidatus Cloacimonadota bacterium]|nr:MAG: dihydropteroate synthase [Candidatus Cloacimonadota bacterium]
MNRILCINNIDDIKRELSRIGVSTQGIEAMSLKSTGIALKLKNIRIGAANIIKQNMLSIGGDAAVSKGVVNGKKEISDVIILGNISELQKLIDKLSYQDIFEIPEIRKNIKQLLNLYYYPKHNELNCRGYKFSLDKPLLMGILNITPDSFYDGNKYLNKEKALTHCEDMIKQGVDIIDIGGESTRPGAESVSITQEIDRVMPILEQIVKNFNVPVSIDTYKSEVAKIALEIGANMVNDISALTFDENMGKILASYVDVPVVLMHIKGTPKNMQINPSYKDVIEEIMEFLDNAINRAKQFGIKDENIIIDPGIGFGKRLQDNITIIKKLAEFKPLDKPILVGTSRKSFIGHILNLELEKRLTGTIAANLLCLINGANILRVHDITPHRHLIDFWQYFTNYNITN